MPLNLTYQLVIDFEFSRSWIHPVVYSVKKSKQLYDLLLSQAELLNFILVFSSLVLSNMQKFEEKLYGTRKKVLKSAKHNIMCCY